MHHDAASSLTGTVEKVIEPMIPGDAEKVEKLLRRSRRTRQTTPTFTSRVPPVSSRREATWRTGEAFRRYI